MTFRALKRFLAIMVAAILLPAVSGGARTLRYTDHEPLGGMRTRFLKDVFFAAVERESQGRLTIADHWDSALATGYDALRVVREGGGADIGVVVPEYAARDLPLHQIFKSFPVGPAGDRQIAFFRRAYAEIPDFPAELEKNNLVNLFFATGYPVAFFSAKPLNALTDIKGEQWRSASFWHQDFLRNAGARPVSMPWGQGVFDALQARTLDGLMVNIDSGYMLNVHRTAPHVLASRDLWLGHIYLVAMNRDVWNGLAQEDRDAIRRAAESAYSALGSVMETSFEAMVKAMRREGATIRLLDKSEADSFAAAARYRDVQAAWARAEEDKGVANVGATMEKVRAIMNDVMR